MKYRIRNIETGKIISLSHLLLDDSGNIVSVDNAGDISTDENLKPEMEVANGVYVGDYLLIYTDRSPLIAQVVMRDGLPALSGFSSQFVPIYLPINLILTNECEVIQCR